MANFIIGQRVNALVSRRDGYGQPATANARFYVGEYARAPLLTPVSYQQSLRFFFNDDCQNCHPSTTAAGTPVNCTLTRSSVNLSSGTELSGLRHLTKFSSSMSQM